MPRIRQRLSDEGRHIAVGAVALVLIVLLFSFAAGSDSGALGGYRIKARFNSVEGVVRDSPVRLSGVQIGRIAGLDYDSGSQRAVVIMEIRPGIELPDDSIAIVTSEGMLGDRFIRIDPGGSLDMLRDGDEIEFTQDSILFEELLAKVITTVERQRRARSEAGRANDSGGGGQ